MDMHPNIILCYFIAIFVGHFAAKEKFYACTSNPVYCHGPLLDTVQRMRIFPDSKTFVDMPMRYDPADVLEKFEELRSQGNVTRERLENFLKQNFEAAGHELEQWTPGDWVSDPKLIHRIREPRYQEFVRGLNELWKILGRKMKDEIGQHPLRHSLLYVPHPFIVPGDRFREFYYWDTYWIVKGLLLSDMVTTARHLMENILHMVKTYNLVPNGGRIYYTRRSQPPLLTPMVDNYHRFTGDTKFIKDNFPLLEKEYNFWRINRTKVIEAKGRRYKLAFHNVDLGYPRPEGYMEDLEIAEGLAPEEAAKVYSHVASAAESGWDFSTRWFSWDGPDKYNLSSIKTTDIIPVDLNTFLCWNEFLLAKFARLLGDKASMQNYENKARLRWSAMMDLLWNEQDGVWYDYDLNSEKAVKQRQEFYPSNVFPLLLQSKGHFKANVSTVEKVLDYLELHGVLHYPGGIPTSKINSGQQWDFPNAWSPAVSLLVDALVSSESPRAKQAAFNVTAQWVESNYLAWRKYGHMYEKYNVLEKGEPGGGGEYHVQVGFGWSNGVILELLDKFGGELSLDPRFVEKYFPPVKKPVTPTALLVGVSVGSVTVFLLFILILRKCMSDNRRLAYKRTFTHHSNKMPSVIKETIR